MISAARASGPSCPTCGSDDAVPFRSEAEIAREIETRDELFRPLLKTPMRRGELTDLTEYLHGSVARILRCPCGVLLRDDDVDLASWRHDLYEDRVLMRLHEVHAIHFRRRREALASILPSHACVLELGSYAGGFLRVARELDWQVTGVDVGFRTARFTRRLGYETRCATLEECGFEDQSFDGVFVWNCFEQLPAPGETLHEIARILRRGGVLIIRVPDGEFYANCHDPLLLACNGLLGFPHRFGFGAAAMRVMTAEQGLRIRELRRTPGPVPTDGVIRTDAWGERRDLLNGSGVRACGWFEMTCRRV